MVLVTPVDKTSGSTFCVFAGTLEDVISKLRKADPYCQILVEEKDHVRMIVGGILYELSMIVYINTYLTSTVEVQREMGVMEPVEV